MAQHDYVIDNSTGANVRADINNALLAISSNNSGSSAPSTTYALQSFANTTDSMLQLRNAANNAFVNLRKFDGSCPLPDGTNSAPSLFFDDDTNTGCFSSAADTFNVTTGGVERMELGATTIFNDTGANVDFRIEGDTEQNLFYLDAGNDRIALGTSTPSVLFHVTRSSTTAYSSSDTDNDSTVYIENTGAAGHATLEFRAKSGGSSSQTNQATISAIPEADDSRATALTFGTRKQDTTNNEGMRITSTGVVSIGTTSPNASANKFHVENSGENNVYFVGNTSTLGARITLQNKSGTANSHSQIEGADGGGQGVANIKFYNKNDGNNEGAMAFETRPSGGIGEEAMRIDSSQRIAIGTTGTSSQFQIGTAAGGYTWDVGDTPQVLIAGVNNESPTSGSLNIAFRIADENDNTMFQVNNTGGGNFDLGRVGIGVSSPDAMLHLESNGVSTIRLTDNDTSAENDAMIGKIEFETRDSNASGISADLLVEMVDTTSGACSMFMRTGTPSTLGTRMVISSGGKLTVAGVYNGVTTGGSPVYVESDGDLLRFTSSSKYKTDIETLEDTRADNILNCRPVWYKSTCANDIKTEGATKSDWGWYGFIAEEVATVDPRLVSWATKDSVETEGSAHNKSVERDPSKYTAEGVRYDNFVPLLVNLLKRQKSQIEVLETKVAALEAA